MLIQILGTGCAKCQKLADVARQAAEELGQPFELMKVTNLQDIMAFKVMVTPALVVNGTVKIAGRVPGVEDVKKLLKEGVGR